MPPDLKCVRGSTGAAESVILTVMKRLGGVTLPLSIAGAILAAPASAQFVRLQRCAGALPCAIPFAVRYAPDPLVAGQYGRAAGTAVSGRISLEKKPEVELDAPRLSRDHSENAARRFLLAHPPPGARPTPTPARPAP